MSEVSRPIGTHELSRFEDIKAWQLARKLTKEVYEVTKRESFRRDFELKGQIRAASGSIMHNIAEGFDAGSDAEFVRFLGIARRSTAEVRSELYVAIDQAYIDSNEFNHLYDLAGQCRNALNGLIDYLKRDANSKIQTPQSKLLSQKS